MPVSFDLKGRTALITGGTRGIGRALAAGLGSAGAGVYVTGRDSDGVEETVASLHAHGIDADGIVWDITETDQAAAVVARIVNDRGALDILVNNAGIIERERAEDLSLDSWQRVLSTNLTGAFALAQAAGRTMIPRRYGRIVNVASVLSFSGGNNVVAYATAKGGMVQLTRSLATEWSRHGVTTNAIAPGYVETDLTAALRKDSMRSGALLSRIPAGRWATGEDIVGAAVFLSSDAAAYVSGAVLPVDGGWLAA